MIFKISLLLQHFIKSRIEKDWAGVDPFCWRYGEFFLLFIPKGDSRSWLLPGGGDLQPCGCCILVTAASTGWISKWGRCSHSLLQAGIRPFHTDAHWDKNTCSGEATAGSFWDPTPFPISGRRSVHSESLPAHADLRAGAHVANEVRPRWADHGDLPGMGNGRQQLLPWRQVLPCTDRTFVVLSSFTGEEFEVLWGTFCAANCK